MEPLLLQSANVIDETGAVSSGKDLFLRDGVIAWVAPAGTRTPELPHQTLDCSALFVTPGFAVLHAHSPMHILRGLAEDVHIDDWFNREIWPYESKLTPEDLYWGSRLCCAELLEKGVTAFADHYFGGEQVAQAALDSGIRADIAATVFGFDGDPGPEIAAAQALLGQYRENPMVHVRLGPHSPYLCSPAVLETLSATAREWGVGLHLHLSETKAQVEESYAKYGCSPVAVAARAGCFTVPCIAAHGLWLQEEDLPLLAPDTFFAACPKTYLKLGMGEGGLWQHWERMNLCIGTDGAASSNTVDPLEQVRLFALLGKWHDRAREFPLARMWQVLMNGHNALGFHSGRIAPGYAADLNLWDLSSPSTAPLYDPLAAILYSAGSSNILHTLVGGRFVKRDGRLLADPAPLLENVSRCARDISIRGKGSSRLFF